MYYCTVLFTLHTWNHLFSVLSEYSMILRILKCAQEVCVLLQTWKQTHHLSVGLNFSLISQFYIPKIKQGLKVFQSYLNIITHFFPPPAVIQAPVPCVKLRPICSEETENPPVSLGACFSTLDLLPVFTAVFFNSSLT